MSAESAAPRPLAIVVVNYGSSDLLAQNLVISQRAAAADIVVVVDNVSTSAERERVRRLAADHAWQLVEPDTNLGFGGGVNAGVARAREHGAQDLVLLNPDAVLREGCVARLRARDPAHRALCAPRIVTSTGATWFAGADVYLSDGVTRGRAKRPVHPGDDRWEWLTGACLWVPVELWDAAGGFDESYFLYWEDVDFSHRVQRAGGELVVVDDAVAVHDEGGTQTDRSRRGHAKSELYYYYNIRNRMLFAAKHLDDAGVRRWRSGMLSSAKEILLRGGRRQLVQSAAPWRAAVRGIRDGRRIAAGHVPGR